MVRSMDNVCNDILSKPRNDTRADQETRQESFIRVNFFIAKSQRDKLKEYTQKIGPAHIKISQSELIRYMIENFNLEKAKQNYFKI